MKRAIIAALLVLSFGFALAVGPPSANISSGTVRAKLWLPDAQNGYYQGTRFDWSGSVASLEANGHSYFGVWFPSYDPKKHDSITGPVEDFAPLNYAESKPGETFIKIGIGVLKRPEEQAYRFSNPHELLDNGKWSVRTGSDFVEYRHELSDPKSGFAYVYTKTVGLTPGKSQMTIEHNIKNTGTKAIATTVYNHGFFMLDSQPTGPDFTVRFPFDIKISRELAGMAEVRGKQIVYLQELEERTPAPAGGAPGAAQGRGGATGGGRQTVSSPIEGFSTTDPKDFDIRVENRKTRAGVRITGDRPLFRINFWSIRTTVCPEAYVEVKADAGKDFSWKLTYDFYTLPQGGAR